MVAALWAATAAACDSPSWWATAVSDERAGDRRGVRLADPVEGHHLGQHPVLGERRHSASTSGA